MSKKESYLDTWSKVIDKSAEIAKKKQHERNKTLETYKENLDPSNLKVDQLLNHYEKAIGLTGTFDKTEAAIHKKMVSKLRAEIKTRMEK